jgi:hypothetical protein
MRVAAVKGPEPVASVIAVVAGVEAIRSGMMNSGLAVGRASASVTSAKGRDSFRRKPRSPVVSSVAVAASSARPTTSRCPQRRMEAMTSAARTGWPSWKLRPSRSVKA